MAAMPPAARAVIDELDHKPWPIVESFLAAVVDAECRRALIHENMSEAIASRDAAVDSQVAWLGGLLATSDTVEAKGSARTDMVKQVEHQEASNLLFSAERLLRAEDVAAAVVDTLDHPRLVRTLPATRGALAYLIQPFPALGLRVLERFAARGGRHRVQRSS